MRAHIMELIQNKSNYRAGILNWRITDQNTDFFEQCGVRANQRLAKVRNIMERL